MWETNPEKIEKLKEQDRLEFGHEGFEASYGCGGYVPFKTCMDIVKLARQKLSTDLIARRFNLYLTDTLTLITYWSRYVPDDADIYDVNSCGGKEYSEIRNLKTQGPLTDDDLQDILIDIYLFQKGDKKQRKHGKNRNQDT